MPISEVMEAKGLSDAQLAELAQVSPETARLWRHGQRKPSPEKAKELAKLLEVGKHEIRPDLWDPPPEQAAA